MKKLSLEGDKQNAFIILTIIAVLMILSAAVYYRVQYIQLKTSSDYPLQEWKTGDLINNNTLIFGVNRVWTDDRDVPNAWELQDGYTFLLADISFKNLADSVYQLSPISTMKIEDDSGNSYGVSSSPYIQNSVGGPVGARETVSGQVGFSVPDTLKSGYLVFDPKVANSHIIRVKIEL